MHQFQTSPLGSIELDDRVFRYVDCVMWSGRLTIQLTNSQLSRLNPSGQEMLFAH